MISFEDFKKMNLKTGKIISVESHPDADKLYVIKIDIGGEQKQSVAGLKPHFEPEQLINKTVAVLTNIEPGKLRGIESQVMILVITVDKEMVLLVPEKEVPSGSKIS